ncbi:type 1 fimbria pilin [Citrobacter amalonaticus]|uniref:fimbrial protein n=1 Tax=Citrobacter amalonaticus TaxID=35703 RepID=UPI00209F8A7D|nr:hypothetical protein [Citrobacter amalonaticus]MCP1628188.1 type 1 fimbria pilin [Citrobacter amalonaticus]
MTFFKVAVVIFCTHVCFVFAATMDCEPSTSSGGDNYDKWSEVHVPFELMPSNINVTVGKDIPDYTILYTFKRVLVNVEAGSCTGGTRYWTDFGLLSTPILLNTISGKKILSTNVQGIGISINDSVNNSWAFEPYPRTEGGLPQKSNGTGMWIDIVLWKVPGTIPLINGPITVNGPEVGIFYEDNGFNPVTSQDSSRIYQISSSGINYGFGPAYLAGSRILQATFIFQPGTCNIEGDNVNVKMGEYDGANGHSAWKDASFKLICPTGYGYGGAYDTNRTGEYTYPYNISPGGTYVDNNKSNGRVQISIVPLNNGAIDPNRGIIALDGTGAQGYGIQLAWGDYSTQNASEPVNPVILNSYVDVHSLNAAFSDQLTPINGNGFTGGDNTIKMAARYIRTSGDTAPGPANAVVQVIANYQ